MFQKCRQPGYSPKQEALKHLPLGTVCERKEAMGIIGYVIIIPDGTEIVSAGNAQQAWEKSIDYARRHNLIKDDS
jgi:hypothetical protein